MKEAGEAVSVVGEKLMPVTGAVTGLATAAVETAADFETTMSQVQATLGITKDHMGTLNGASVNTMDTLEKLDRQLSADTKFSAEEAGYQVSTLYSL